jgi:hypothetical protein
VSYGPDNQLVCDMIEDCPNPVTHIGEKGYVYCTGHAPQRRGWERVRKLRPHELNRLRRGEPLKKY